MTPASSITIAALFTAGFAASVAAVPREPRPATPPSAVSSSALPSCSTDGNRNRKYIGGKGFRGGSASGMYGQVFFANGGASRAASAETSSGGRFSAGLPGSGNGNQDSVGANGPGRGSNAAGEAPFGQGRGNGPIKDAGVGAVVNPEPGTLLLIGAGLGAMAFRKRRQARKAQGL